MLCEHLKHIEEHHMGTTGRSYQENKQGKGIKKEIKIMYS